MASDRIVFKLSSPACSVSGTHTHTTPALGPWVPGDLQRWHLAHASDDDYFAALDLAYTRVTLGDEWPDALCLDGSKGAYYMYRALLNAITRCTYHHFSVCCTS
jgi:hypothetical protein